MTIKWKQIQDNPKYKSASPNKQIDVKEKYFDGYVKQQPSFIKASPENQQRLEATFWGVEDTGKKAGMPGYLRAETAIAKRRSSFEELKKELTTWTPSQYKESDSKLAQRLPYWALMGMKGPTIALKKTMLMWERGEAAFSNAMMEIQDSDLPDPEKNRVIAKYEAEAKNLKKELVGAWKGLTGERKGQIGDIYRRVLPEKVDVDTTVSVGLPGLGAANIPIKGEFSTEPIAATMGLGTFLLGAGMISGLEKAGKKAVASKYFAETPLRLRVKSLNKLRVMEKDLALKDSENFIRGVERYIPKKIRELIPFMREGTEVPKELNRPDLIKTLGALRDGTLWSKKGKSGIDRLNSWTSKVGRYLDNSHKYIMKEQGKTVGFWENYIPRIWDTTGKSKKQVTELAGRFSKHNPFQGRRVIKTLESGIKDFGLKPLTTDIVELLRTYDKFKINTSANIKFGKLLRRMGKKLEFKVFATKKNAPPGWIAFDHHAFNINVPSVGRKGKKVLTSYPSYVHPEVLPLLKAVTEGPFEHGAAQFFTNISAMAKASALAISGFHATALTETGIAISPKILAKTFSPARIWKTIKTGKTPFFQDVKLARDSIRHGVNYGSISDVAVNRISGMLKGAETRLNKSLLTKPAGYAVKGVRKFKEVYDNVLWDYMHTTYKLYGYEHLVNRTLRKKLPAGVSPTMAKKEIAQFVNDSFGGQSYEAMMIHPKFQQAMHWALLAPDWTISTLRQALAPTGFGAVAKASMGVRKKVAKDFWVRAGLVFYGGANMLNYAITKKEYGKGRFMWDNPKGSKTKIFIGKSDTGTEEYMRHGKQFRELFEYFTNPVGKIGGKLNPWVRETIEQFSGHSVGGFPQKYADKGFYEGFPERVVALGEVFKPYVIDSNSVIGAMGKSKGMTPYRSRKHFTQALESNDKKLIEETVIACLESNIDPIKNLKRARTEIKSEKTLKSGKFAWEIYERVMSLSKEHRKDYFDSMQASRHWNDKVEDKFKEIVIEQAKVKKMADAYHASQLARNN